MEAIWRTALLLLYCTIRAISPLAQSNVLYPSYRFNQRNFWLEYSTPPSTVFPEYDTDVYDEWRSSTPPSSPPSSEDNNNNNNNHNRGVAAGRVVFSSGPRFVHGTERNHTVGTAPVGGTVVLDCVVANLSDYQVSWFRRKGSALHVLTIGKETFSADDRYSIVLKSEEENEKEEKSPRVASSFSSSLSSSTSSAGTNWALRIHPAAKEDNGTYICQISTHPPILLVSHLKVIAPVVRLLDEEDGREISEKHYKPGSTIELHCEVTNYLPEFEAVLWRHKGEVITPAGERGGISIKTKEMNGSLLSHLYVASADAGDSGVYSCGLAGGNLLQASAKLSLHILNGEEPAAIQSSSANANDVFFFVVFGGRTRRTTLNLFIPIVLFGFFVRAILDHLFFFV